jgi:hypothetical protein
MKSFYSCLSWLKFIGAMVLVLGLTSCAQYPLPGEKDSFGKYDHIKDQSSQTLPIPQLTYFPMPALKEIPRGKERGLASEKSGRENGEKLSHRRLYFMILLNQYVQFEKYLGPLPKIKFCPQFHTQMLENPGPTHSQNDGGIRFFERFYNPSLDFLKNSLNNLGVLYPELSLPLAFDEPRPMVWDIINREDSAQVGGSSGLVQRAINIHARKIQMELIELCDTGQSAHYFKFENLINTVGTEVKNKNENKGERHFGPVGKISLIVNMALLNSLSAHLQSDDENLDKGTFNNSNSNVGLKKVNEFYLQLTGQLWERLNISWGPEYFKELKKRKSNLIKN